MMGQELCFNNCNWRKLQNGSIWVEINTLQVKCKYSLCGVMCGGVEVVGTKIQQPNR